MTVCDRCGKAASERIARVEAVMVHGLHPTLLHEPKEPAMDVCDKCLGAFKDVVQSFLRLRYFHEKN